MTKKYVNGVLVDLTEAEETARNAEVAQATIDIENFKLTEGRVYPTWQEQMDMQYWDNVNGTTTWKDAVAKVKSDNPKD